MSATAQDVVRLRVALPDDIVTLYEKEALQRGVEIETILSERLIASATHTSNKPLYFNDSERQELEKLVGKNLSSTREALRQVRDCVTVRVQGVKIGIKPAVLARLKSRCLGMEWEPFLTKIILDDLERYAGLR